MKSRRTRALEIPSKVKADVWERDNGRCILCGSRNAAPNAHFIPRSDGGLGIPENIVTLCWPCHMAYDQSENRKAIGARIERYLSARYPIWDKNALRYRKDRI